MRPHRRGIAAALSAAIVAVSLPALAVLGTAGAAHAVIGSIAINEVESNGDPDGDWVELTNNADFKVDISGWQLRDNDDTHSAVTIPQGTTIAAGGFYMVYIDPTRFALGENDTVTLYLNTGTPVDSYTWTSHATTSYGLCPDIHGGVEFAGTILPTPNAANLCSSVRGGLPTEVWPGSPIPVVSDGANPDLGNDVSGVAFDPADANTLWVVRNSDGRLFKLKKLGDWGYADGWAGGVLLKDASGGGTIDAEGVVVGPDGAVYVSSERDQVSSATSKNAVLRYVVPDNLQGSTSLTATREWDLPHSLVPALDPNKGLEGLTWVPDEYLTSNGFKDKDGNLYDPASYSGHGTGLFVAAHEGTGQLYVLALDHTAGTAGLVATVDPGLVTTTNPPAPHVADVFFDDERQQLWAVCDNDCGGQTTVLKIANGAFAVQHAYDRPTGMDNLNNEGFAIAPPSGCDDGLEEVVWAEDGNTDGNSLRSGTLECTKLVVPVIAPNIDADPNPDPYPSSWPEYGDSTAPLAVTVRTDTGVVPTGTVTITHGQTILGTATLNEDGNTSVDCSTTSLKVGNNLVTVRYSGDGAVAAGTAKAIIHLAKATSYLVQPPDSTVAYGKAASIPVTVKTVTNSTPTGAVSVYDGNNPLGTAELDEEGKGNVMLAAGSLSVGVHTLSVQYEGDEFTKPATEQPSPTNVTLTVTRASATVTAAGSSVASGQPVSIPVAVSAEGVVPSGTVTVKAGPTTLGSATLVQGTATVDLAAGTLALGAHDLTVTYTGDTSVAPASSTVQVTVSDPHAQTSSATVTATGASVSYGQTATIPVKVTGNGVVPTGSVTVLAGSTPLATATLNAGQATLTIPARSLPPASHVLTLTYSGDGKVKAATGSLTLTVTKATATIDKPTIRPKRIIVNKTKARVLVKVAATGLTPTGKVTIIGKGIRTKTATLRTDGTVTVKLAKFKKRGLRKLTISYSGDTYLEAASTTLTVRVKPQAH